MEPLPECKKPELKLVIWPDECLKYAVADFPEQELSSQEVRNIAGGMVRAMYKHYGVGMAAPQVAIPFRIFVMDAYWTKEGSKKHPKVFLNPEITGVGDYAVELPHPGEGCLSFPYDYHSPVKRHDKIELQWMDFKGDTHHEWFEGYEAIVIQHEYDHLNGHCFIDRLSLLKQGMAIRRARKMRRRYRNGMKRGMQLFKQMQKSPEGMWDRNKAFEARRREMLGSDNCEVCKGEKGGMKGNENVIDGVVTCDYCHAEQMEHSESCHVKVRSAMVNECNCHLKELEND